jgi:uncharacterized protein
MKQTRIAPFSEEHSIRVEKDSEGNSFFIGYAAVYNSESRLITERGRTFNEILEPGCFNRVLADPNKDLVLTLDHNHFYNLGRTKSGNLQVESDNVGLKFRASVPRTSLGADTEEMIRRGDYTDCSFCFDVDDAGEIWEMGKDKKLIHRVKEVSGLYDLAICTLKGAYGQTIIDVERVSRAFKELDEEDLAEVKRKKEENDAMILRQQELRKLELSGLNG